MRARERIEASPDARAFAAPYPKRPLEQREALERAKGIEPSYEAWEASVLPLNYARSIASAMAGEARLELATPGFGDRCSTN